MVDDLSATERFVLCDAEGTEIREVPPDMVEVVAQRCRQMRIGYVKKVIERRPELMDGAPRPAP